MKYLIFKLYLYIKYYIFPGERGTYFEYALVFAH